MKNKSCIVIDYGLGNTFSVLNALKIIGVNPILTSEANLIKNADRVILPGVGAFGKGMEKLKKSGIDEALFEYISKERPLLGICLGMQLLMDIGYEFGENKGLSLIPGKVEKINIYDTKSKKIRVPLIGWYKTFIHKNHFSYGKELAREISGNFFYYVHSYSVITENQENLLAYVTHSNNKITSAICDKNILGVQFHPERSGKYGLKLIQSFMNL